MPKLLLALAPLVAAAAMAGAQDPGPPVVVVETVKGTIAFEVYPEDAPRSVEHILRLVREKFYDGQRFHRAERSLVQVGDPLSRDPAQRPRWGTGGSGTAIGVAEYSRRRRHARGAVGLAFAGVPENADSQIYFMKAGDDRLDGLHVVIGRVIEGMDVVDRLGIGDQITRAYVKGGDPSAPRLRLIPRRRP